MAISKFEIEAAADDLQRALVSAQPTARLLDRLPDLDVDSAYAIQLWNVKRALASGRRISGKKIGLTSKAMQNMFNVDTPDYGHLFSDMEVTNGRIERARMIQPKVEAEIAFVLSRDLDNPREISTQDVLDSTDYVIAALEIVDTRMGDWKISLVDTVADNASSGMYVLGNVQKKISEIDLKNETMDLYKNGKKMNSGRGTDVLGDPAYCVAWLANKMRNYGTLLKKGEVILSGALSAAIAAEKGDVFKAVYSSLGQVEVTFY